MSRVPVPPWMKFALAAAGVYNLAWAATAIAAPAWSFRVNGMATPEQPLANETIWQGMGLVIGLFGVGYLIAARDPVKHWAVVFVGFLGKVLGPLGFLGAAAQGRMPWSAGVPLIFNDLIWWVPLALVLGRAWQAYRNDDGEPPPSSPEAALGAARTHHGTTLADLSRASPVLLIFLRHLG
jgi:hypothetical protein